jgi:poly(A) polymerase
MLELLPETAGPLLPWAVILHDVAKPVTASRDPVSGSIHFYGHEKVGAEMAHSMLERLRFSRQEIDEITAAVRHHMQFKDAVQMRRATRRRILMRSSYPLERELHRLDCLGSHGDLESYECFRAEEAALATRPDLLPPLLNGDDLIGLGLRPGPRLGALLAELRDRQLQEELDTREDALAWARERIAAMRADGP